MSASGALDFNYWSEVQKVKHCVNKVMEAARKDIGLKGSLSAEVTLYCDASISTLLEQLGDELRFVTITSQADVLPLEQADATAKDTELEGLKIAVSLSEKAKCERCWHHSDTVGQIEAHTTLCQRCVDNVDGDGEQRQFA